MTIDRSCMNCGVGFKLDDDDLEYLKRIAPRFNGQSYAIPSPTLCPNCRLQRRMTYRNQIYVCIRPSSNTGKPIFSMFTEDVPFPVIEKETWWGDSWSALDYGRDFNFNEPFFTQFEKLRNEVPHFPLSVLRMENSDYCNQAGGLKSCYLTFNSNEAEDCIGCEHVNWARDCLDCTDCPKSELCFDCISCARCYNLQSSAHCEDSSDSYFLLNCRSCRFCFGSANLRRREYCIFNKQVTPEEYEEFIGGLNLASYKERTAWADKCRKFHLTQPVPHVYARRTEGFSGNFIYDSKDVYESFLIKNGENVKYCFWLYEGAKDCRDLTNFGIKTELVYESAVCGIGAFNLKFCYDCWDSVSDLIYCYMCMSTSDCFGCVGLRKGRYCILNKQYSAEEYNALVPKIIEHMTKTKEWGEFFPVRLAPFPYNHTTAQRYFPLGQEEVREFGFQWHEKEMLSTEGVVEGVQLPDRVPEGDSPLTFKSLKSGRVYKLSTQEIKRYRKFNAPLPRLTYDERMDERIAFLGGVTLLERTCAKSGKPLRTPYSPETGWIIWERDLYEREFGA